MPFGLQRVLFEVIAFKYTQRRVTDMARAPWRFESVKKIQDFLIIGVTSSYRPHKAMTVTIPAGDAKRLAEQIQAALSQ